MIPLLLLSLCAAACLHAAPVKVACIGDSITEGTGLASPATESYPARLQRLLGTNYVVRNYGVSGRTLLRKGDFPYWSEAFFRQSTNWAPDVVIIQLGTNDSKPQNWRYSTNYLSDYKDLIAVYQRQTNAPKLFLCTPCRVFAKGAFDISPGVVATNIAPMVRGLGAELSLPVIDLHTRLGARTNWFPDTVHPDSKGMTGMAAVMYEAVGTALPDEPPASVLLERLGSTRVVLRWPAKWGGLIPQTTAALNTAKTPWTVLETSFAYGDGEWMRLTNTINTRLRAFQLVRP